MIRVRKQAEVREMIQERIAKSAARRVTQEDWHKHWEKEGVKVEKRLGGGKRPKIVREIREFTSTANA